jgi:hypothetical protein
MDQRYQSRLYETNPEILSSASGGVHKPRCQQAYTKRGGGHLISPNLLFQAFCTSGFDAEKMNNYVFHKTLQDSKSNLQGNPKDVFPVTIICPGLFQPSVPEW